MKKKDEGRFDVVITTLQGLEQLCAREVTDLGGNAVRDSNRVVYCNGDKDFIYKANLRLRTGLKVLKPLSSFMVRDELDLYKRSKRIDWPAIFDTSQTFAIDTAVNSPVIKHSQFAMHRLKDAIVDRFRESSGRRPSIDPKRPDISIHLHISNRECHVSLNSSGEPLNKRGYRPREAEAPLNEVLAAGIIQLIDWRGNIPLIDPMCGSGTLAVEAALLNSNIAPGLLRKSFGFVGWRDFDEELFDTIREATVNKITPNPGMIEAYDRSLPAVNQTRDALRYGKIEDLVKVKRQNFFHMEPTSQAGVLVMNPPYDRRVEQHDIDIFYTSIGDKLKKSFPGYTAWIFSASKEGLKSVGLKASKKIKLKNGPLDSELRKYELFEGSLKKGE